MPRVDYEFHAAFRRIAHRLNGMPACDDSRPNYDKMAGAIVWTDELPSFATDVDERGAMRMIWNYRTSIILGNPRREREDLWGFAQAVAPNWPVFKIERFLPTEELLALIPDARAQQE